MDANRYKCRVCNRTIGVNTFEQIVKRRKLCSVHIDVKEENIELEAKKIRKSKRAPYIKKEVMEVFSGTNVSGKCIARDIKKKKKRRIVMN